ncbi:MAG TPA: hypothetical protein ENG22_03845 [Candidatus Bathyarchaeota archaeon]|nr:hypothetical protein [Candidatus Bathyarchaeota archaeon]
MNTREYCFVSVFTSLAIACRVAKNIVTSLQFVNIPLVFTFSAAILISPAAGALVGFFSMLISDMIIAPGPWTIIDSVLAGLSGLIVGKIFRRTRINIAENKWGSFVVIFLTMFSVYDFMSSFAFYMLFTGNVVSSAVLALLGLFIPVYGGCYIGIGPLTEFTTVSLTIAISTICQKIVEG